MLDNFDIYKASQRFIEIRTNAGKTQEQLAEELGVNSQTIKNYEKAGSPNAQSTSSNSRVNAIAGMKIETLYKLAKLFNVSADYLLGLSDIPTPDLDMQNAMRYTGLSQSAIDEIKSLQNPLIHKRQGEILNWILSNMHFTSGLTSRLHNLERASSSYSAADNAFHHTIQSVDDEQATIQNEAVFNSILFRSDAEDRMELALFRVNKEFDRLLNDFSKTFCTPIDNSTSENEEDYL